MAITEKNSIGINYGFLECISYIQHCSENYSTKPNSALQDTIQLLYDLWQSIKYSENVKKFCKIWSGKPWEFYFPKLLISQKETCWRQYICLLQKSPSDERKAHDLKMFQSNFDELFVEKINWSLPQKHKIQAFVISSTNPKINFLASIFLNFFLLKDS